MKMSHHLAMIIFGASGDLACKKLFPSLYMLYQRGEMPTHFTLSGTARTPYTNEAFRAHLRPYLPDEPAVHNFLQRVNYLCMNPTEETDYLKLEHLIRLYEVEADRERLHLIYYLATPPLLYRVIPLNLHKAGLLRHDMHCRIVIEKPFGNDWKSACELNRLYKLFFPESRIFRMDHFLGKETVQNLLTLRFANTFFESLWNSRYISHVEITAVESEGIGSLGGYFDTTGTLRDMVQNHLLQLVAFVAMEAPAGMEADALRDEVIRVYQSLRPFTEEELHHSIVRGQYLAGDKAEAAYREERGVSPSSRTETFVAMRLYVETRRWQGTPFYIRTGKRMPTKVTEIVLHFRPSSSRLFTPLDTDRLVIRIQPDEGIVLRFALKEPGNGFSTKYVDMDFSYSEWIDRPLPDAYSRLLQDCMTGDNTLFTRADAVEAGWKFLMPLLDYWRTHPEVPLYGYPSGTWGPEEADRLIADNGTWSNPCRNLTHTRQYCQL